VTDQISGFVNGLRLAGLDPTSEDVADILWLALQMRSSAGLAVDISRAPPGPGTGPSTPSGPGTGFIEPDPVRSTRPHDPTPLTSAGTRRERRADVVTMGTGRSGLPFSAPGVPALPGALGIARALRPLKRRIASRTRFVLDEAATVQRIADEGLWTPVLRPAPARWLDVALVVDESATMVIWQQTAAELRRLLERHGAFRDVRMWRLVTDADDGQIHLFSSSDAPSVVHARTVAPADPAVARRSRSLRELIDPGGQRLILVLSDCVSAGWRNGDVADVLAAWGERGPVAIVQVLPQHFWSRSALGAETVEIRATHPGMPSAALIAEHEVGMRFASAIDEVWAALLDLAEPSRLTHAEMPIPVLTLEPASVRPWARLVAGAPGAVTTGVLMKHRTSGPSEDALAAGNGVTALTPLLTGLANQDEDAEDAAVPVPRTPLEHVQRFRAVASPTAFRLAGYLSSAPLTVPVMHLVQQVMLPESRQVHLAEVFLSGLLEQKTVADPALPPDHIEYDFLAGVRELLLPTVVRGESFRVLEAVSSFVEHRIGYALDFPSLLTDGRAGTDPIPGGALPFATIAASVLERLGGEYAQMAKRLHERLIFTRTRVPEEEIAAAAAPGDPRGVGPGTDPTPKPSDPVVDGPEPPTPPPEVPPSRYPEIRIQLDRVPLPGLPGDSSFPLLVEATFLLDDAPDGGNRLHQTMDRAPLDLDLDRLWQLERDPTLYGQALASSLLAVQGLAALFAESRRQAAERGLPLYVRLAIRPREVELHALHWEAIPDALARLSPTTPSAPILFAREPGELLSPVPLTPPRQKADLRALVAVASAPANAGGRSDEIATELTIIQGTLSGLGTTALPAGEVTKDALKAQLHEGCDVIYLSVRPGGSTSPDSMGTYLWLDEAVLNGHLLADEELVLMLRSMTTGPRLIVLVVRVSDGPSDLVHLERGRINMLAARLVEAGVPAVLTISTTNRGEARRVASTFFRRVLDNGQIDRSVAAARSGSGVMPEALYLRTGAELLWEDAAAPVATTPPVVPPVSPVPPGGSRTEGVSEDARRQVAGALGFVSQEREQQIWSTILNAIRNDACTPIIGPGFISPLVGTWREIAQRWAVEFEYPFSLGHHDDFERVARHVAASRSRAFLQEALARALRDAALRRFDIDPDAQEYQAPLELLRAAWRDLAGADETEPHRVLAALPLSLYVTANPDDTLADALRAFGKEPRVEVCRWNDRVGPSESPARADPYPTPSEPLVFHLFGHLSDPQSLVLTVADYDEYLVRISEQSTAIPNVVRRAFASTTLLALGHDTDERRFEALMGTVRTTGGRFPDASRASVVQIDPPEASEGQNSERIRRARELDFVQDAFTIYWGQVTQFTGELAARWPTEPSRPEPA
jgi:hypothetical protein